MSSPVLGIMTLYLNEHRALEERSIYRRMILEGRKRGLDIYVFTPADVHPGGKQIEAMVFHSEKGWSREWRSFPDIIFDRCRIQRNRRFQQLLSFRQKYGHLLFLNRPLRNKWTIHQTLSAKTAFREHLPDTLLYQDMSDVNKMLKASSLIYLKPINGTGGRGILRIERSSEANTVLVQGRDQKRRIITPRKVHLSRLGSLLQNWNMKDKYLVQQGIQLQLPNGRVHDYRMLVQKNGEGQWELTGCAGRMGAKKSVTSNLHGGGQAVAMHKLMKQWITDEKQRVEINATAEKFGIDVATFLENTYGNLCELALDLAIDKSGHIYLLEVNPKPAREVFARIGEKDIYSKAITQPLEYALWVYRNHANATHPPRGVKVTKPVKRVKGKSPILKRTRKSRS
ncbi:YheC/YheD family protein [Paenibacillus sp. OK003]|uniref:YheC/YheD family endospore coat-associated protein n=1 Tax=Paenibacillus sp. OK003 TaxID=1884380 RepID=UPI0008AE88D0|nr:YheC/YheD family protein [Paenibacillus sp. OK003]SEL86635.1 Glutathione synthase/RimK-type ligase, ATP-grasp superfamily [Paenibacillus sp. OK003]